MQEETVVAGLGRNKSTPKENLYDAIGVVRECFDLSKSASRSKRKVSVSRVTASIKSAERYIRLRVFELRRFRLLHSTQVACYSILHFVP